MICISKFIKCIKNSQQPVSTLIAAFLSGLRAHMSLTCTCTGPYQAVMCTHAPTQALRVCCAFLCSTRGACPLPEVLFRICQAVRQGLTSLVTVGSQVFSRHLGRVPGQPCIARHMIPSCSAYKLCLTVGNLDGMCRWLAQLLVNVGHAHSDPQFRDIMEPTGMQS